ncbi:hypothetical protein E3N88_28726 [Mikania micrantha]|uniref:Transposase-associated domain-containing protein n=1 Tax=Mikania micrantha TaxID=192012 RepID=A0A5N6N342_9ASTR|nr:hypothetical protein E3N88_28726 [Mikania micrantha]
MNLKVMNKWTDNSSELLNLLHEVLPDGNNFPKSYYDVRMLLCEAGLGYELIDVCQYDCAIFYRDNKDAITCPFCQSSRYVRNKIAYKKLRYFSIAPHLKRLYAFRHTAKDMRLHKEVRKDEDGAPPHPADGKAWKHFDDLPKSPDKDFDAFSRPIVDDLKVLWHDGVEAYDVYSKSHFTLYAVVLWTISDFPAYAYFSGWRKSLQFDGKQEKREKPRQFTGDDILRQLAEIASCSTGKAPSNEDRKRKRDEELPDTSLIVRNDVEPKSLSYEVVLAIRNANASVHDLIDTDDEHDDLGRIFLNNESILDSETDHDSTDPDHNSDDDDSFA